MITDINRIEHTFLNILDEVNKALNRKEIDQITAIGIKRISSEWALKELKELSEREGESWKTFEVRKFIEELFLETEVLYRLLKIEIELELKREDRQLEENVNWEVVAFFGKLSEKNSLEGNVLLLLSSLLLN